MTGKASFAILFCGAIGCAVKTEQAADTSSAASSVTTTRPDSVVFVPGDSNVHPVEPAAGKPALPPPPVDTSWPSAGTSFTVSPNSFGPLRVGMTVAQAAKAMGGGFGAPAGYSGGCGYATLTKAPKGLAVMLDEGKIARFEVRSGGIATAAGAKIGDTEARIKSLYGSAVTSSPHKYVQGGHYLTVTPVARADAAYKTIFETDGKQVTEFRSGKSPEVEQVERCG
jgi:hypothetical protein